MHIWPLFFGLSIPLLIMVWGEFTLIHGSLGILIMVFVLSVLGAGAVMESRGQERAMWKAPELAADRQPLVAGIKDMVYTVAGSVLGVGTLLIVVLFLAHFAGGHK